MNVAKHRIGPDRIVFGPESGVCPLIEEVNTLGWSCFRAADPYHLSPHQHDDFYEICLIIDGEVEWIVNDTVYILRGGDLFITRPGEVHQGVDAAMQPCTLYWMLLSPQLTGGNWLRLPPDESSVLVQALKHLPFHKWRADEKVTIAFRSLFNEHVAFYDAGEHEVLGRTASTAALQCFIVALARCAKTWLNILAEKCDVTSPVERAKGIIRKTLGEPLPLPELFSATSQDFDRFNRHFHNVVGLSIAEFRNRERVREAKNMLRSGRCSITEIATDLGYSSSQHFATAFRRITGFTPSDFRRNNASEFQAR